MEDSAAEFKKLSLSIKQKELTKDLMKVDPEPLKALI
jgi:hypothetical protein